ncbi:glycoside hydrolase family 3 protein [Faecalicatena orotica]|uniref:Beta-glucosidase n=1 Tax=Faecalicatena orotica TaxID=1544 RepID=A0A2Y9BPH4_9FIRM|nr:glycoside hydrolase family 3 C-terminal domain-containing protein [Faecalicatena orotica]PWJ21578.1 beta-glucosidase [Faecalicatena orotica]SSA58389.1 beta-glucosidase [Faecalicatena orotica]
MKGKWKALLFVLAASFLILGNRQSGIVYAVEATEVTGGAGIDEDAGAADDSGAPSNGEAADTPGDNSEESSDFMSHMTMEKPEAEKKQIDSEATTSNSKNTYAVYAIVAIGIIFALVIAIILITNFVKNIGKKAYNRIMAGTLSVMFLITAAANVLALGKYNLVMDKTFGTGELKITKEEGSEDWDAAYNKTGTSSKEEAIENGQHQTETEEEEGAVLMKNEKSALPLSDSEKNVTLLGINSVYICAGAQGEDVSGQAGEFTSLQKGLELAGFSVNPSTIELYNGLSQNDNYKYETKLTNTTDESVAITKVYQYGHNSAGFSNDEPWIIGEVETDRYTEEIENTYKDYSGAAIVTVTRVGGEGSDLATDMGQYSDYGGEEGKHYLELDTDEQNLIRYAKEHFSKVIVLINSSNVMELGELAETKTVDNLGVDSILWIGGVGGTGTKAVGRLLSGEVNPSGRTADIYPADLTKDPAWNNFGTYQYSNIDENNSPASGAYQVEYEEGIYVGYRYYETAAAEAQAGNFDSYSYDDAVVYPFGYGLSYTSFDMQYNNTPVYEDETFTFEITVTNTGDVPGKQVAEIYAETPYTYGGVEKSKVVLAGFAKTERLEPGESQNVTISIARDDLASYDYQKEKCYLLDEGTYKFYLSENSHSWASIDSTDSSKYFEYTLDGIVYDNDDTKRNSDEVTAVNQMDEITNYHFVDYTHDNADEGYAHNMTREDFAGSFPTSPTDTDLIAGDDVISGINYDVQASMDESDEMPTTQADNGLQLINLRGKDYDDSMWDDILDQLSVEEMHSICAYGHFETSEIASIGAPVTSDIDSPNGFVNFFKPDLVSNGYTTETVLASTWNTEVAAGRGNCIGEEALQNGINGWYGPGLNLHRSAFGGRNNEYYSEDPLLGGSIAAAECSAAENKGLMIYAKHYAFNNQEAHRNEVLCTWVNEQAARELYLKTYEIYAKDSTAEVVCLDEEGKSYTVEMQGIGGIMTAYNMIGAIWAGGCEATVHTILRDEWGLDGAAITDAIGASNAYANPDQAIRDGSDLLLAYDLAMSDTSSATAVSSLRESTHHILYAKVNSNAMNGIAPGTIISYGIAPWKVAVILCDVMAVLLLAIGIILMKKRNTKVTIEMNLEK